MRKHLFFAVSTVLVLLGWAYSLFVIGADKDQGDVFRIMFVHVPAAWCALMWVMVSGVFAAVGLVRRQSLERWDHRSQAAMELGTLFGALALATGMIWGRPTWGVWWDWDPRLTSMLVLFLVSCGYHILRSYTPNVSQRRNVAAITSILCMVNVPVVYYSVNLWRSVHQPQTFTSRANTASSDISVTLFVNVLFLILFSISLSRLRTKAIKQGEALAAARESV